MDFRIRLLIVACALFMISASVSADKDISELIEEEESNAKEFEPEEDRGDDVQFLMDRETFDSEIKSAEDKKLWGRRRRRRLRLSGIAPEGKSQFWGRRRRRRPNRPSPGKSMEW
ncbi:hypothetical protein TrispH2_011084 [Trichoplax sp. H2]|nr:hypothetical protein TrispH2_011084 [Trichoplax sp. H2]|eukprot:RDD36983.1 hypothetical protein TrispH2_011084 [Trichoplax sp. H2]